MKERRKRTQVCHPLGFVGERTDSEDSTTCKHIFKLLFHTFFRHVGLNETNTLYVYSALKFTKDSQYIYHMILSAVLLGRVFSCLFYR